MACDSPYYVTPKAYLQAVPVPCGRCPPCKIRRVNSWVFRLMQEEKRSTSAHFVTFTYDTDHVPISPNGYMTLVKSDFQDFMKRLRKACEYAWIMRNAGQIPLKDMPRLKYYAVGEYGTSNSRPHYHAIIFNVPHEKLFADAWSLDGRQLGGVFVGKVTSDSVAYCMKYIDKSNFKKRHGRDDRQPEFPLMSKHLGDNYLTDAMVKYHKADLTRLYATKEGGYKIALPKYYRDKIYSDSEKKFQIAAIQDIVELDELMKRRAFQGDYDAFKGAEKYARHRKFYSRQKMRKL